MTMQPLIDETDWPARGARRRPAPDESGSKPVKKRKTAHTPADLVPCPSCGVRLAASLVARVLNPQSPESCPRVTS